LVEPFPLEGFPGSVIRVLRKVSRFKSNKTRETDRHKEEHQKTRMNEERIESSITRKKEERDVVERKKKRKKEEIGIDLKRIAK
jgi:ACT domain-containing protein